MHRRAIARITVGNRSEGTGSLVSAGGLVLTALHVIADLDLSRQRGRLAPIQGTITLAFGDPIDPPSCWSTTATLVVSPPLYSIEHDWAVLRIAGAIPAGVDPLVLAKAAAVAAADPWSTFGFPAGTGALAGWYDGTVQAWTDRDAQLHSAAATGVLMSGISGAPCLIGGKLVGLIDRAILDGNGVCHGGVLTARNVAAIAAAAAGHLPFENDDGTDVPFRRRVTELLPDTPQLRKDASTALKLPYTPAPDEIARRLLLAEVDVAGSALRGMHVPHARGRDVIRMVAAAKLHHDAIARLVEATAALKPASVQASDDAVCGWYVRRAGDAIDHDDLSDWTLYLPMAGLEEASLDDILERLSELSRELVDRAEPEVRADRKEYWRRALAGKPQFRFWIALREEKRRERLAALRARLPNAVVLVVYETHNALPPEMRADVEVVTPVIEDEEALLDSYVLAINSV